MNIDRPDRFPNDEEAISEVVSDISAVHVDLLNPVIAKDNPELSDRSIEYLVRDNLQLRQQLSRQQRAENALLATKRRLQRLISSSPSVIFSSQVSSDYGIIFVSKSIEQFGYQPQDFLENIGLWRQCIHPEDSLSVLETLNRLSQAGNCVFEYRFLNRYNEYRWIRDQRRLILDEAGVPLEIVGSWQDITERKLMEQALFNEKELAQNVLQSIGDAVITTDACGYIQYLNPVAEQITEWRAEQSKRLSLFDVLRIDRHGDKRPLTSLVATVKSSGKILTLPQASILLSRSGREHTIDGSIAPIRDRDNQIVGTVVVFRDITQHHALARKLSWQASHDFLTGLTNRREFEQQLAEAITSAKERGQRHTLCYLDLDRFRIVNDTCGHAAGDELLRQISVLIRRRLRASDAFARIGGDEFGIILYECELSQSTGILNHLLSLIQGFRFVWQNNSFSLGASMGLVSIDPDSGDINSILGAADAACYAAKDGGRNRFHLYQSDDLELAKQRGERQWVTRIQQALEDNRFHLYKQDIVPVASSSSAKVHYEILLRMVSETGEILSPMAFIPAAERYSLMQSLDRWVIANFFANYANLPDVRAKSDCIYAINLSGLSVNDEQFLYFLQEQFTVHEISPSNICFEITETAAIANLTRAAALIEEIRSLGCSFALDDFGSGMSSFTYLKNLPVDYVKIDGSFIKNMIDDPIDRTFVECINKIGHEIGMQTIAEFVENESILSYLNELGIDYAQGYAIGKPSPLMPQT
jgi:diguanylate cyclase (GGDEF)-like protein/PAS domain S-box-containing protein